MEVSTVYTISEDPAASQHGDDKNHSDCMGYQQLISEQRFVVNVLTDLVMLRLNDSRKPNILNK
jgi:hypothetical protein